MHFAANNVWAGVRGRGLSTEEEYREVRLLQESVPAGEPLLVWISKPYLLDFRRNPIYVVDWPGGAGPAPGLPYRKEPSAVVDYLRSVGIRYFAHDRSIRSAYKGSESDLIDRPIWGKTVTLRALDLMACLDQMIVTEKLQHQRGGFVVLDLGPVEPKR